MLELDEPNNQQQNVLKDMRQYIENESLPRVTTVVQGQRSSADVLKDQQQPKKAPVKTKNNKRIVHEPHQDPATFEQYIDFTLKPKRVPVKRRQTAAQLEAANLLVIQWYRNRQEQEAKKADQWIASQAQLAQRLIDEAAEKVVTIQETNRYWRKQEAKKAHEVKKEAVQEEFAVKAETKFRKDLREQTQKNIAEAKRHAANQEAGVPGYQPANTDWKTFGKDLKKVEKMNKNKLKNSNADQA